MLGHTNLYQGPMTAFPKTSVTSRVTTYYCEIAVRITHTNTVQYTCLREHTVHTLLIIMLHSKKNITEKHRNKIQKQNQKLN